MLCAAVPMAQAASVRHYDLQLEPDLSAGTVQGRLALSVAAGGSDVLQLDAGALQIDAVRTEGRVLAFEKQGSRLTIPVHGDRVVEIDYRGKPASGMKFLPEAQQLYTVFSTSQWMPCIDAPDQRATLVLKLLLPSALKVAATGRLLRTEDRDGKTLTTWTLETPTPSYLFGFAAGPFREVMDTEGAPTLRFLASPEFSEEELRRIFADTRRMIGFYEERSGVPYAAGTYTQVLVNESAAQELAGMAVMGRNYGRRVLADPKKTWLGAHELSHQWWGNAVTNAAWTEFWLNEGVAAFMNAAWFEQRWGRDEYLSYIDAARESYEKLRAAGADKALVFADWNRPTAQDRALVYDKGAYVMHLLRERMGEAAFWRGLNQYTRQHWGRPVTSRDFQAAMQAATPMALAPFFEQWVLRRVP